MRYVFIFFLLMSTAICQTQLIAHRSHSGSTSAFVPASGPDNFGLPPMRSYLDTLLLLPDGRLLRVEYMSPRSALAKRNPATETRSTDTVSVEQFFGQEQIPANMDSVQALYPETRFVGFGLKKERYRERHDRNGLGGWVNETLPPAGPMALVGLCLLIGLLATWLHLRPSRQTMA